MSAVTGVPEARILEPVRRGAPRWLAWAGYGAVFFVVLIFAVTSSSFLTPGNISSTLRSEERRVGKECPV